MEKNNQEISLAFLQAGATVPGIMTGETSLSDSKVPGLKMHLTDRGLICSKGNVSFFIPNTNIKVAILKKGKED